MRIGCATWLLGADKLLEAVRAACDAGLTAVSLNYAPIERLLPDELRELNHLMESHDLVATLHTSVGLAGDEQWPWVLQFRLAWIREWHEQTGRLACVTFDPGFIVDGEARIFDVARSSAALRSAAEVFAPLGVKVGIEYSHRCLNTVRLVTEFAEAANFPHVGQLLDLGHLNMCVQRGECDATEFILNSPLEIVELHVHSNNGERDEHRPLDEGTLDLAPVVAALKTRGFDGIATLENLGFETGSEAAKAWRKCAAIFREAWDGARL